MGGIKECADQIINYNLSNISEELRRSCSFFFGLIVSITFNLVPGLK